MSYELRINHTAEKIDEALEHVASVDHEDLAKAVINYLLNEFISRTHNRQEDVENDEHHVPYFGWFWRDVDFFNANRTDIAHGLGYTGICQNNKWGYPERPLTEEELAEFRNRVFAAYKASRKGGLLSEIWEETDRLLAHAGDYIRELDIQDD